MGYSSKHFDIIVTGNKSMVLEYVNSLEERLHVFVVPGSSVNENADLFKQFVTVYFSLESKVFVEDFSSDLTRNLELRLSWQDKKKSYSAVKLRGDTNWIKREKPLPFTEASDSDDMPMVSEYESLELYEERVKSEGWRV